MNNPLPKTSVVAKIIDAYIKWNEISRHIPKMRRYSIGIKIDSLFVEILESVYLAQFSKKEDRAIYLEKSIVKNDLLKAMLYVLLELKGIEEKHFLNIGRQMDEIGKILYGWKNQSTKNTNQNKHLT